jgi:hypothetical protein
VGASSVNRDLLLQRLKKLPARKRGGLSDALSGKVDKVPDDGVADVKSLSGTADADALIVIDVSVTKRSRHHLSAFIAMHGFSGKS